MTRREPIRFSIALVFSVALLIALAITGKAHAVALTAYDATKCRGDTYSTDSQLTRTTARIQNLTSNTQTIHCPIVKTTSGPGRIDDHFGSAEIPIESTGALVGCAVEILKTAIPYPATANLVSRIGGGSTSSATPIFIAPSHYTPSGYWNAGGTSTTGWYFAELKCTLPPGTGLRDYTIMEQGTRQTGYRIYPAASCAEDVSNTISWRFVAPEDTFPGGFIMGQASGGAAKFAMNCPIANNAVAQMAVGRATGGNVLGCNLDSTNLSTLTWTASTGGTEWPSEVLPRSGQPVMAIPSTGAHALTCGVNSAQGDGKLISYRVQPQPSRTTWGVLGSHGTGAGNATDNNAATRWTPGANGASGQWFRIDFGSAKTFRQITMDSGTSGNDYARGYEIHVSDDGTNWGNPITTGTGTNTFISKTFTQQTKRYLRVRLTGGFTAWWSLHEVNVY